MSIATALTAARRGTVFLSIVCFAISYIALADLARVAGLGPEAYLWPVMIDGTIVVGTVAVVAAGGDRASWSLLVAAAVVSIAGNGTHAWITQGSWIAVGVALTSPVFLLWTTHVTVALGRRAEALAPVVPVAIATGPETAVEPTPEPTQAEKRARALELYTGDPTLPTREIARRVQTDESNVRRWVKAARNETTSLVGVST